ncbi:MAG: hypothetical protein KGQ46_13950 [Hyphomicrobiales bacterium]|nr:hypothetical protein [Hyphomicrobiales bacterium]MDE2115808.1 hypothetical protein [Hyphomicrobiales bacterium]
MLISSANADVPVMDAARLGQQTQTRNQVTTTVTAVSGTQTATSGIHCATTTGAAVPVVNPAATPQDGAATLQALAPQLATLGPASGASQSSFSSMGNAAGSVLAGINASAQTGSSTASAYQKLSSLIGRAQTVMQAMDQNSAVRAQNGETAAAAVVAANQLTQAYNTKNLDIISQISGVASALGAGTTPNSASSSIAINASSVCPLGMIGAGTLASPCVESACSTTAYGIAPDPACATQRLVDSYGNVRVFLARVQDQFVGLTPSN